MTQQASEKKIVIVDDEMDMRFFLMTLVKSLGCLPVTSKNGKQGLNKIKQEKPDLVTLDVMMPERGGTFIFREMKKDPELVKIPVIIISGVNRDSFYHYLQMLQTGQKINKPGREPKNRIAKNSRSRYDPRYFPDYYIEKPVDPEYLKHIILKIFGLSPD